MKQTIKLSESQWNRIYQDIAGNYAPSVLLIRERMKQVLGFTSRRHRQWIEPLGAEHLGLRGHWDEFIVLDFYSEKKMSWFRLKYSEYLNESR